MNISAYTPSDTNMYLSNTYMMYKNNPIKISNIDHYDRSSSRVSMFISSVTPTGRIEHSEIKVPLNEEFELTPVPLGYYNMGNFVVYLYKHQRSHFKKLLCNETLRYFVPQDRELRVMSVSYSVDYTKVILKGQEFLSLDEAYEKMQSKKVFSVALHPNYAIVKKGSNRKLVIYYKTDPVILYDGEELTSLVDDCHITKFKLELGL